VFLFRCGGGGGGGGGSGVCLVKVIEGLLLLPHCFERAHKYVQSRRSAEAGSETMGGTLTTPCQTPPVGNLGSNQEPFVKDARAALENSVLFSV